MHTLKRTPQLIIGIDPGIKTGFAVKDISKGFLNVETLKIHEAFEKVKELSKRFEVAVVFEDARKRKWFGKRANVNQQGAGAIKIQCTQWEDFLLDMKIPYLAQDPKNIPTKTSPKMFQLQTKWKGRTSEHARDAAMMVNGINPVNFKILAFNYLK